MRQSEAGRRAFERIAEPLLNRERELFGRLVKGPEGWARVINAIRRDEDILDEALGTTVGPRPRVTAADLEPALGAGHVLQPYLDELVAFLPEVTVPGSEVSEGYVGVFPADAFNAQARTTPEGIVVLVNTGLISLAGRIAVTSAMALSPAAAAPLYTAQEIVAELAKVLAAVALAGRASAAPPPPRLDSVRSATATAIQAGIVLFAIAHELGHVASGHLLPSEARSGEGCGPEQPGRATAVEIAADAFAANILDGIAASRPPNAGDAFAVAGGAVSFLAIWCAYERAREAIAGDGEDRASDDGALTEIEVRRAALGSRHAGPGRGPGESFEAWLAEVTDLAIGVIADALANE